MGVRIKTRGRIAYKELLEEGARDEAHVAREDVCWDLNDPC